MPRRTRKKIVGKFEERNGRERERELRQLRRELRRQWRQRQQAHTGEVSIDDTSTEPSQSPDA